MKKIIILIFVLTCISYAQKTVTPSWVKGVANDTADVLRGELLAKEAFADSFGTQTTSILNTTTANSFTVGSGSGTGANKIKLESTTNTIGATATLKAPFITGDIIITLPNTTSTLVTTTQLGNKLDKDAFGDSLDANFITGTDSIHYGVDSIVVTHGVGSIPSFIFIQLMSDSFGYRVWVNTIGTTTFAVKRNSSVSIETPTTYIKFKWMAYK